MWPDRYDKIPFSPVSYMRSYSRTKNGAGHSSILRTVSSQRYRDISLDP